MAEPQSRTCASSQELLRALGLGAQTLKRFVPIKPNRTGQLEWACCFYLDRPMTNPQGAFNGGGWPTRHGVPALPNGPQ